MVHVSHAPAANQRLRHVSMFTANSVNFCKGEDCPSSQDLLDYQNGDLDRERSVDTRIHLRSCEFCTAEVEFYSLYPNANDETCSGPEAMPEPLFELAEALLKFPRQVHTLNALQIELGETAA